MRVCIPGSPQPGFLEQLRARLDRGVELADDGYHVFVVNTGRGPIVDEPALFDVLRAGRLRAGLDVWYRYPEDEAARVGTPPAALPFYELDNVVMSPHRGGLCAEAERLRAVSLAEMLNAGARGEPMPGRVDLDAGY